MEVSWDVALWVTRWDQSQAELGGPAGLFQPQGFWGSAALSPAGRLGSSMVLWLEVVDGNRKTNLS